VIQNENQGSSMALLPIIVYLGLSLSISLVLGSAKAVPPLVLMMVAVGVAFAMNRNIGFNTKIDIFARGAGDSNIIVMVLVFLLAGIFTTVSKSMGGVDSVVNLSLTVVPPELMVPGLFVVGCFISFAMGTSVGTIVALGPIAMGICEKTGLPAAFAMGAVVSGAIFGDNLSIISDTTIAATRLCGVEMKDKFKANFLIALPAAILTVFAYIFMSKGISVVELGALEYNIVKVMPYIIVIVTALLGLNVFVVLLTGILLSALVGFYYGSFTLLEFAGIAYDGMMGMANIAFIAILIGGIVGIVTYNGGIAWILNFINKRIKTKKQAEAGIAALATFCEICTGNNTVAIVTAGPIAKQICDEHGVDPRRAASLLDIFACVFHTNIPYSGNMLAAAGVTGLNPLLIIPFTTYSHLLFISAVIAIAIGFPKLKPMVAKVEP
jgi:Na+/H+ antiporter NhaC